MTAEQIPTPAVERIVAPQPTRDATDDIVPFYWDYWAVEDGQHIPVQDDRLLSAHRPKQAVLLAAAAVLAEVDENSEELDPKLFGLLDGFIAAVLDTDSAQYVRERLEDPDDPRDIDPDLQMLVSTLVGKWYGRPTVSRVASQRPRSSTGKRSTARSRSTAQTRKR